MATNRTSQGGDGPEVPRDASNTRRIGIAIVLLAFGAFGGWAAYAELDAAAVAPGVVEVASHEQVVEHEHGGTVERIHVRDGDRVAKGDVLVEIDDTDVRAELESVRVQHAAARAERLRLEAERDGREELDLATAGLQNSDDPHFARALAAQRALFQTRDKSFRAEIDLLEQRAAALRAQIRGVRAVVEARRDSRSQYEEELAELEELVDERLTGRERQRELQRLIVENRGEIAELESEIDRLEVEITETDLQTAQRRSERAVEIANRLNEVEQRFQELDQRRNALESRLDRMTVRAPADGLVHQLNIHTEGAVIDAGRRIATIVPTKEDLIVEARVRPVDIDSLEEGQHADVRMTAYSFRTTPVLVGSVEYISPGRIQDEDTGEEYYKARIRIDDGERERALGDDPFLPGMPAEVMIRTGERTFLSYLLKPLTDAFNRAFRES